MTTKKANITIEEYIEMSEVDFNEAVNYEFTSDTCQLANSIYQSLFKFFDKKNFSGDLIFTWKSPSLVKEGDYIGRRDSQVDNLRVIGNIFPNYLTNRKYSLNMNRNGCMGDFPHDFFDIYLDHVAKYAYEQKVNNIKEYYPLKRAILHQENALYFRFFSNFDDFLEKNYLKTIWQVSKETPFSEMDFNMFKNISEKIIFERGSKMLNDLKSNYKKIASLYKLYSRIQIVYIVDLLNL
ncbi:hypothetical protein [Streptococcus pseudopneumoniae]|nr:hypothetical protein [Streptococcus pseudopneumoniae]VOA62497.1 Uncharacterised protein [Streptococcus pneumoniae]ETE04867.1 hypothetical protein U751_07995 [Streptococcus pseudopneumoniae 22725]KPL39858.1 hypothetical protein SPSSI1_08095 [Streptococcus pseudopneumoniae]KPL42190.1 hypothetical protein SPSSI2_03145 [Streptococcus pseudopneumoniae]NIB64337.1 hypothetical protein [Streptococcus pseudopneumoniae]